MDSPDSTSKPSSSDLCKPSYPEKPSDLDKLSDGSAKPTAVNSMAWQPYEESSLPPKHRNLIRARSTSAWWLQSHPFPRVPLLCHVSNGMFIFLAVLLGLCAWTGVTWISDEPNSSGNPAAVAMIVVFLLATRYGVVQWLFGVPFERALGGHFLVGYVAVGSAISHGIHAMYRQDIWNPADWTAVYWTGWISTIAMVLLYLTAFRFIRRRIWNFFHIAHWVLFIVAVIAALAHGAGAVAACLAVFLIDLGWRVYTARRRAAPRVATLTKLPADVVRISFPNRDADYRFEAGQYINMHIGKAARLEFHPISISTAPPQPRAVHAEAGLGDEEKGDGLRLEMEKDVAIHLRKLGNWSKAVYDLAGDAGPVEVPVIVEGPYGAVAMDIQGDKYRHFLLVSGGIGITPMQSLANHLLEQHNRGRPIAKIFFVWTVRDKEMVDALYPQETANETGSRRELPPAFQPDLISHNAAQSAVDEGAFSGSGVLRTEFYLTRPRPDTADGTAPGTTTDNLKLGRPDLAATIREIAGLAEADGGRRVAVMTCGPKGLVDEVKRESTKHKNCDVHAEVFEF
mmetsp:Transcript_12459/g.33024  ORF Transcript_12459/g.33024 Transcript_12459/m.33024 type:complete len:569 (-) Transcript_12459:88-1794(-)